MEVDSISLVPNFIELNDLMPEAFCVVNNPLLRKTFWNIF